MVASNAGGEGTTSQASSAKGVIGAIAPEDLAVGSGKLSAAEKSQVIKKFQINTQDVGSPEVQIALLTRRLESLTKHFSGHKKDYHSQRGMLNIISRRKRLLSYLKREDIARYRSTIAALGLRK